MPNVLWYVIWCILWYHTGTWHGQGKTADWGSTFISAEDDKGTPPSKEGNNAKRAWAQPPIHPYKVPMPQGTLHHEILHTASPWTVQRRRCWQDLPQSLQPSSLWVQQGCLVSTLVSGISSFYCMWCFIWCNNVCLTCCCLTCCITQ